MTNFIQLLPSGTPPIQYCVNGAANPLFVPANLLIMNTTQLTATQRNTTQANPNANANEATTFRPPSSQPTPMVRALGLGEGMLFQCHSGTKASTPQAPCADIAPLDSQLPHRPTCPMPYHPDVGVNRVEHSENASCKFYVACPARIQGTYNTRDSGNSREVHFAAWEDSDYLL
ncbi:hypothetical protein K438DRAFT_1777189 [Mycena galopus ATCC 62051]|nr:hypothetical protein K438DRAFT_1777189 [Mycena galopus ATCC 62051]